MKNKYQKQVFALLFASGDPVTAEKIAVAMEVEQELVSSLIQKIKDRLEDEGSPLQILRLADQYQLATRVEYTPVISKMMDERRNKVLSPASFEVLAAIAYNQPVTRGYVEQVRGVDSSGVINSLIEKGLLEEAGRLDLPGRPIAYQVSPNFLRTFGLADLGELPTNSEEIEDMLTDLMIEGTTEKEQLEFEQVIDKI